MSLDDRDWYREGMKRREAQYFPKPFRRPRQDQRQAHEKPAFALPPLDAPPRPAKPWPTWLLVLVWVWVLLIGYSIARWFLREIGQWRRLRSIQAYFTPAPSRSTPSLS